MRKTCRGDRRKSGEGKAASDLIGWDGAAVILGLFPADGDGGSDRVDRDSTLRGLIWTAV